MNLNLGTLSIVSGNIRKDLLAEPTASVISALSNSEDFGVAEIDPTFSDTAAFCEKYGVTSDQVANCVIVKATRGETVRYAACMILGTTKADVNGLVRRHLDARKASFAPMDEAVALTKMEYGGITCVGLPSDWPILIDTAVADSKLVVIGSGIRKSKLIISGKTLGSLPNAVILEGLGMKRE
jgi:prolyl-tRNA editing enzyme YbaK/EbsC (Cys-tRNA(Pro) deacylase)